MSDILFAGPQKNKFAPLMKLMEMDGEEVRIVDSAPFDDGFMPEFEKDPPSVVISYFDETDLKSVKAMQVAKLNNPAVQFIYLLDREIRSDLLTLSFNEGSFCFLHEPFNSEEVKRLVVKAIKRARLEQNILQTSAAMHEQNKKMIERIRDLEEEPVHSRARLLGVSRLALALISDRAFKPESVRVMLVSDSQYQRKMIHDMLAKYRLNVHDFESGEAALAGADKFKPQIVVSDYDLPGIGGVELCERMKSSGKFKGLHFVILTADELLIAKGRNMKSSVNDFILKPASKEDYDIIAALITVGVLGPS